MMASSILFWIFGFGGTINHIEGAVLFSGIFVFTLIMIRLSIRERKNNKEEESFARESERVHKLPLLARFIIYSVMTIVGMFLLMLGSEWLIESATNIARALGVSEVVIGLSLVAFGTSLPELATAIIAIVRKENEILLGNIVGSNIFNILFVGGFLSTFFTAPINQRIIAIDLPIMLIVSLFLVVIVLKRKKISRLTSSLLFIIYITYISYIFLNQA
jgi:cation:H+ antiporter